MSIIIPANTLAAAGGFDVDNSCRFDSASSADLRISDYSGAGTSRKTRTYSMWIKRSELSYAVIFGSAGKDHWVFGADHKIQINIGSGTDSRRITDMLFKDTSAWYHIVFAYDTTQSTAANRFTMWVNGAVATTSIVSGKNEVAEDEEALVFINGDTHTIGSDEDGASYFDGYMAEWVFVDGQKLDADSFGEYDEDSGIWKPIDVSGITLGTNGFYLDFQTASDLGIDAGNDNDFEPTNLAATDQATDTCTNNFCTMNPLIPTTNATFSEGNCKLAIGGSSIQGAGIGTFGLTTGKWYWEIKLLADKDNHTHGVISELTEELYTNVTAIQNDGGVTSWINGDGGEVVVDGTASGADYGIMAENSIMGIALDLDNFKITYLDDNSALVSNFNLSAERGTIFPLIKMGINCTAEVNFGGCSAFAVSSANSDADGHGNFEHAPPSGYFAICSKNLAEYG